MSGVEEHLTVYYHRGGIGRELGLNNRHVSVLVELPPVKGERLGSLTAEHNVDIVNASDIGVNQICECGGGESCVVPVYGHLAERLTLHVVNVELNGAVTLLLAYHSHHSLLARVLEVDRANAYPVAVVDIGHKVILAAAMIHLQTAGLSLCLGLHALVGVQVLDGSHHTLLGLRYERECAVGVPLELLHAGRTVITAATGQTAVVVEHKVAALERDVTAVNGKAVLSLVHNTSAVGPRAVDGRSR